MIRVVGSGKLARELLSALPGIASTEVVAWADPAGSGPCSVVVHAGSGRELDEVVAYCRETGTPLVELATGSALENSDVDFPVVVCPNTNILMLKFLSMLAVSGHLFKGYTVRLLESHQAQKSSVAGTAVALADSLGVPHDEIRSIRDPREQLETLGIPPESLHRHAYHRIEIEDHAGSVVLETKVFGPAPYAQGLARILSAIRSNRLESRRYSVLEFIERGWV